MKKIKLPMMLVLFLVLMGCPKQLLKIEKLPIDVGGVRLDNLTAPILVSSGAVKVSALSDNEIKAEIKNNSANILNNSRIVGDNSKVEMNNSVVVTSSVITAFLATAKPWQFIFVIIIAAVLVYFLIMFEKEVK